MTRVSAILLCVLFAFSAQAKGLKSAPWRFQKVLDADIAVPKHIGVKGSSQGFAIWGNTAFSFHDKGLFISFDLKSKKMLGMGHIDIKGTHSNNAIFSSRRLTPASRYPLCYISECKGKHRCLVTEIDENSARTVQQIYYSGEGYEQYFDWFLDEERGEICTYGGMNGEGHPDIKTIKRFPLPALGQKEVRYTPKDQIGEDIIIEDLDVFQGSVLKDGILWLGEGYPPLRRSVAAYSYPEGKLLGRTEVSKTIGLEPEGLSIQGKWLYVSFHTSRKPRNNEIYRFRIR